MKTGIACVLVLALVLRAAPIDGGAPFLLYGPEEPEHIERAKRAP